MADVSQAIDSYDVQKAKVVVPVALKGLTDSIERGEWFMVRVYSAILVEQAETILKG